jgi:diguanylate cyclase (GGDEF)-like protein
VPSPQSNGVRTTNLLAIEAAMAIERARTVGALESEALTDVLTSLPNRRAWEDELPRQMARASREGTPLCIAVIDLDHFKAYNDSHGHVAGDRLLQETATRWRRRLRLGDFLARYGGEEFVLALPDCDLAAAEHLWERLRLATAGEGQTCSAGLACWDGLENGESLLQRADSALYAAKKAGRDRAMVG